MNMEMLEYFLCEEKAKWFEFEFSKMVTGMGDTIYTIYAPDSSTLIYLNNNGAKVVYSSWKTGIILVQSN